MTTPYRVIGSFTNRSSPRYGVFLTLSDAEPTAVDASTGACLDLSTGRKWRIRNLPQHSYISDAATTTDGVTYLAMGARTWSTEKSSWFLARLDIGTSTIEPLPWFSGRWFPVSLAAAGSCLIVGLAAIADSNGAMSEGGICEIDCITGRRRWLYRRAAGDLFSPSSLAIGTESLYVVDSTDHVLLALAGSRLRLLVGAPGSPGRAPDRLNSPSGVSARDGLLFVSDSRNQRVQVFDEGGSLLSTLGAESSGSARRLKDPRSALPSPTGGVFVADPGYRSVTRWSVCPAAEEHRWGPAPPGGMALSFPRSFDVSRGGLWIADSNHNRVLGVQDDPRRPGTTIDRAAGTELSWPRSARWNPSQSLVAVSDGLNRRVVVLDEANDAVAELNSSTLGLPMEDPHDARWLSDTELVITDSAAAVVSLVDLGKRVAWASSDFVDPHHAAIHRDTVLVADPELSAIVVLDIATGRRIRVIDSLTAPDGSVFPLTRPRTCRATRDGVVIADESGRVFFTDSSLCLEYSWDGRYQLDGNTEQLRAPRDIGVVGSTLIASDYRNDIVVFIELTVVQQRARMRN